MGEERRLFGFERIAAVRQRTAAALVAPFVSALMLACSGNTSTDPGGGTGGSAESAGTGGTSGGSPGSGGGQDQAGGSGGSGTAGQGTGGVSNTGGAAGSGGVAPCEIGAAGAAGEGAWTVVGEEDILGFSPGGPHDIAVAADGTPYIGVRHVGPQSCAMCPPPLEPHVARFSGSVWQDLNPEAFSEAEGGFPAVEVRPEGVPVAVVGHAVWELDETTWQSLPSIPEEYSHKKTIPEFAIGRDGSAYVAVQSEAGTSVLRLGESSWSEVGGGPLPVEDTYAGASLAAAADGQLFVAVRNIDISVFALESNAWQRIGPVIPAERAVTPTAIAVPGDGRPFVGFVTSSTTLSSLSLVRFEGEAWVGTGPIQVSGYAAQGAVSLAATEQNPLATVSYYDSDLDVDRRTVVAWSGSEWFPLGADGYRTGAESGGVETKLAVAGSCVPYVLYQTETGFTVKKFE